MMIPTTMMRPRTNSDLAVTRNELALTRNVLRELLERIGAPVLCSGCDSRVILVCSPSQLLLFNVDGSSHEHKEA
jgi:hypothetical protein